MITVIEVACILVLASAVAALVWRVRPRRDICQPMTNEERLLAYIERRAAWECSQRKAKLLQRQRVERLLEQRWLRSAPGAAPIRWPGVTVPSPRQEGA